MGSSLHVYVGPFIEFDNLMIAAFESARGCDNCNVRSRSDAAFCDQCGRAITTYDLAVKKRAVDTFDAAEQIQERMRVWTFGDVDFWMPNREWTAERTTANEDGVIYVDANVLEMRVKFATFFESSIELLEDVYGCDGRLRNGVVSWWW